MTRSGSSAWEQTSHPAAEDHPPTPASPPSLASARCPAVRHILRSLSTMRLSPDRTVNHDLCFEARPTSCLQHPVSAYSSPAHTGITSDAASIQAQSCSHTPPCLSLGREDDELIHTKVSGWGCGENGRVGGNFIVIRVMFESQQCNL